MKKEKITTALFKEVCEKKGGNISEICKALNIERCTFYDWIAKDESFKTAFEDIKETQLDLTESQLMNLIKGVPEFDEEGKFIGWKEKPSEAAIFFKLKTQGKKRGFVEKQEFDHTTNGEKMNTTVIVQNETVLKEIEALKAKFNRE